MMPRRNPWLRLLAAIALLFLSKGGAEAAAVRYHYMPMDSQSCTSMKPACECGETVRWFGRVREPYNCPLRPTVVMTFHHPCTGQNVSVPLALPEDTPRILHGRDRITFDYGSYAVRVLFLPDGSVDVVYDSGFLRAP
jgi:hypothetical protein